MKFMNLKRFASTALAGMMAISLTIPAFAADQKTEFTGTYEETPLAVTVPVTGTVAINPYGLPFSMGEGNTISGQQIATKAPLVIANKSAVALSVSVNTKGTKKGNLTLVNAAPSATANEAQVFFQIFEAPTLAGDAVADQETLNPLFAALKDDSSAKKGEVAVLDATTVAAGTDGNNLLVLREADGDGNVQAGGAAFVRLSGKVTKKPTTAWAATDGFTATVVYTFEPSTYSKPAGTVAGAGGSTVANGGTLQLTLTPDLPANVTVTTWTWKSSDETVATVAALTDTKNATVTNKVASASGTADGTADITVSGVGSDGLTYSASITLTCTGNP